MAQRTTIQPLGDARGTLPYSAEGGSGHGATLNSNTSRYESSANLSRGPISHPQPQDVASLLGIPARLVTPKMLETVGRLLDNQQILRQLREQAQHRIEWLEQELDRHVVAHCLNRRGFLREITLFLRSADVYGVLVLLQVQGLEEIQNRLGLTAVDWVVRTVAERLQTALRNSDLVGYLGVGNFAALLTATDSSHGERKIDRLPQDILTPPLVWHGQDCPLTIRYGSYTLTPDDTTESALIAADRALRGLTPQEVEAASDGWGAGFFADLIAPPPLEDIKSLDSET